MIPLTTFKYKVDENTTHDLTYLRTNDAGYIFATIKGTDKEIFFPADYVEKFIRLGKIVRTEDVLIKIYTAQANEAKEYLKRYKNNPFADKIQYNKDKLKFANKCLKGLTPEKEIKVLNILFEYKGRPVVKEERKDNHVKLTYSDEKTECIKYENYTLTNG